MMTSSMFTVVAVLILGWLLASTIGTWAYFAGRANENDESFRLPKFISK